MATIQLPKPLEITEIHDRVSWVVRGFWDYYGDWFHLDSDIQHSEALKIKYAALESLLSLAHAQSRNNHEIQWLEIQMKNILQQLSKSPQKNSAGCYLT